MVPQILSTGIMSYSMAFQARAIVLYLKCMFYLFIYLFMHFCNTVFETDCRS
jgi:hypothetical protein